ncbi:MAG: hypothetical protein AVDCRST_MAG59-3583, partial [uncultured Thermomicrobiales bacterium]
CEGRWRTTTGSGPAAGTAPGRCARGSWACPWFSPPAACPAPGER